MRVVILQERGHHKANEVYREALNLCRAFKRQKVDAIVCGPGYYNYGQIDSLIAGADVVLCLENYERNGWVPDLSRIKAYTVFWTIDSHVRLGVHLAFAKKHKFNMVLSSTAEIVPAYNRELFFCQWFPNCYPVDLIQKPGIVIKDHDVGFCGLFPSNRKAWYDQVSRITPIHYDTFVIGDAMVKAVSGYRIHLNRNVRNDVNYRTFETLGCGTFLLTNKTDRLMDLFKEEHLALYSDVHDCVAQIHYYLSHEQEREKMALAGYHWVRKHHTYDNRAHTLCSLLKERA
jgi:hypothetical protein